MGWRVALPLAAALLGALSAGACDGDRRASAPPGPASGATAPAGSAAIAPPVPADADRSYALPAAPRIVAIGDLHGDLRATRAVLRLAGAIDEGGHWAGGQLVVVQTGDEIDRGDHDREIVDLFDRLADEARAAGGAVHALNGNHEIMNVQGDLRYVTEGGFKEFEGSTFADPTSPVLGRIPERARARAAAFMPGAPYARKLSGRRIVLMVGDTVFAHAGVLPSHVRYGLGRLNREAQAWMSGSTLGASGRPSAPYAPNPGSAASPPAILTAEDSPVWTRRYGAADLGADDCEVLGRALAAVSAKRMVVGHTVQKGGITPACEGRVWRIDVGMSAYYAGHPEALEIAGDSVRALKAEGASAQ
ncbi:MAG: metallophosphoesterase [Polyangiaceae bacterium]|nr:metallophosphoesterase [Polyangiaceae bacterium]